MQIGERVPELALASHRGERVPLVRAGRRTLIYFFRGRWCAFCMTFLEDLRAASDELAPLGDVRAVSPASVEDIAAVARSLRPPFELLADPEFAAVDRFGLRAAGGGPG